LSGVWEPDSKGHVAQTSSSKTKKKKSMEWVMHTHAHVHEHMPEQISRGHRMLHRRLSPVLTLLPDGGSFTRLSALPATCILMPTTQITHTPHVVFLKADMQHGPSLDLGLCWCLPAGWPYMLLLPALTSTQPTALPPATPCPLRPLHTDQPPT
jgi:hypothetical protein